MTRAEQVAQHAPGAPDDPDAVVPVAAPRPEAAGFEDFYRAHADTVRRALAVTLGDTHVAAEATDEAMTRALARWRKVSTHESPAGWVYQRIRRYPLARRPGRIAANVLLDAARDLRRSVPAPDRPVEAPSAPAAIELADVLVDAVADGILDLRDAQLIAQSRIGGQRVADLAAHHNCGSRTLWDRRQRAEHRVTTWAAATTVPACA
jgi:DNA-directed RNA polymerase specialized sigma24 family protein